MRSSCRQRDQETHQSILLLRFLAAISRKVVRNEAVCISLHAWFHLVQSWCSLRFDEQEGVEPSSLMNTLDALKCLPSRSESYGPDKGPECN